jgi:rubrerythrin
MSDQIEKNLSLAFASESKAAVRNEAFALLAEKEGYTQLARLFRAVANADSVHAHRFLLLTRGKIGNTEANLKEAYRNESRAREEYAPMNEAAKEAPKAVKKAFAQSMKTDMEHAELYEGAMEGFLKRKEVDYYVCQICGHIHEGFAPENCPVCRAVRGRFKRIV